MVDSIEQLKASLGDRYMPERELGRGGMATVYLAEDRKHRRQVALKVVESSGMGGPRFLREIEIAANLSHPRILPVFDSGRIGNLLYYVMPYVEGESLAERLAREPKLPLSDALRIGRDVAEALSYAHAHGVIHRDIKPGNILLTEGGAVVTDFGIAHAASVAEPSLTPTGLLVGTPGYVSPEQVAAETEADHRADIYALGCVLYEMIVGEPPFTGRTVQAVLAGHLSRPPPPARQVRPDVPAALDDLILRTLAKDRTERFGSADELAEGLDYILHVEVADTGDEPATDAKRRQNRLAFVAIAVVAAVLIMVGLFLAGMSREGEGAAMSVVEGADAIAVLPFDASGPGVEGFGQGIVSLLSANLDGVGGIQTVSPRSVFTAWRRTEGGLDFQKALELGRSLEAGSVLMGSLVVAGAEVRLTAELYEVRAATRLAQAQVRGSADSLLALVDTLSIHLLRDVWRSREPIPNLRLSAMFSGSIAAIRHYLRGEYHFGRSTWDSASTYFQRAVEEDSAFALAQWRLSEARAWTTFLGSAAEMAPLRAAYRHREQLPARERTLVVARVLDSQGDISALDSMRAYVARHPYDAEGWFVRADLMVHAMPVAPRPMEEILESFDRALDLQPSMSRALIHPLHLTALAGDSAAYQGYLARLDSLDTETERFAAWGEVLWNGDDPDGGGQLADVLVRTPVSMNAPFIDALLHTRALSAGAIARGFERAAERMPDTAPERSVLDAQRAATLTALGRLVDTAEPLEELWRVDPDHAARLAVEGSIALGVDSPLLPRAEARLSEVAPEDPMASLWLAWLSLHRGRLESADAFLPAVRNRPRSDVPRDTPPLARATAGWMHIARGDSERGIQLMKRALREAGYAAPGRPLWYQLERSLALSPVHREEAIERLRYARSHAMYYAGRFALLANAFEASGRPGEAAAMRERLGRLLATADPSVRLRFDLPARTSATGSGVPAPPVSGSRSGSGERSAFGDVLERAVAASRSAITRSPSPRPVRRRTSR